MQLWISWGTIFYAGADPSATNRRTVFIEGHMAPSAWWAFATVQASREGGPPVGVQPSHSRVK
jgi:hypothetical protein